MSEVIREDYIKKIVDSNQEQLVLVTLSIQNTILIKLQINIQDQFPIPEFKFASYHSHKFNNPTPSQYAVIANKINSLKGLINFLCNQKEDYKCFALPEFEHGLKLDIKSVFCPNCSNTTWPLIHLAVALGHIECLKVLIGFLEDQGRLPDFINNPDDHQRTPLAIAFATGIDEIIDLLLSKGADPYYSHEKDAIKPIVYICIHHADKLKNTIKCIKNRNGDEKCDVFDPIKKLYFDEIGFSYENPDENNSSFSNFLREKNADSYEIFAESQTNSNSEQIHTFESCDHTDQHVDQKNNDSQKNVNQDSSENNKCAHPGCDRTDTTMDISSQKWYCTEHYPNG